MPSARVIIANYNLCSCFRVPKDVPLLSNEENKFGKPWSWWIKWDTLGYVDDKGVEHEIEAYSSASEGDYDFKRPDSVNEDEHEFDSDDDE